MLFTIARAVLYSLWLPLLVLLVSVVRFGSGMWTDGPGMSQVGMLLVFTWPAAIPLTLAAILLHRLSRVAAYVCGAILLPLTVVAAIVGGLFGPVGIFGYALVISLPAWITLLAFRFFGGGKPALQTR